METKIIQKICRYSKRIIFLLIILSALVLPVFSQTPVDKIKELLEAGEVEQSLDLFEKLSTSLEGLNSAEDIYPIFDQLDKTIPHYKYDLMIRYFEIASVMTKNLKDHEKYLLFQSNLIEMYSLRKEKKKAYDLTKMALPLAQDLPSYKMRFYMILGDYFRFYSNYDSSLYYNNKSLRIARELQDTVMIPLQLLSLAGLEAELGNKYDAVDYTMQGIDELRPSQIYLIPGAYKQLSDLFLELNNLPKAKEYAEVALMKAEAINAARYSAYAKMNLGKIAMRKGKWEEALEMFTDAYTYQRAKKDNPGAIAVGTSIAQIYLEMDSLGKVQSLIRSLDSLNSSIIPASHRFRFDLLRAKFEMRKGNIDAAQSILLAIEKDTAKISPDIQIALWESSISTAEKRGDFRKAYLLKGKLESLRDSIRELDESALVYNLEAKFFKAEQDREIVALTAEKQIAKLSLQRKNRQLIGGGILLALLALLASLYYRISQISRRNKEELAQKNTVIEKALKEKNVLLKEIHHRVKNNLQVISSLLKLQTKYTDDVTVLDAIAAGRSRVQSMALLHQNLYKDDDLRGVGMKEYFDNLVQNLFDTYKVSESEITLTKDIDDISLDIDTVVPIGLITNELISNSLKHAFKEGNSGNLHLSLKRGVDSIILTVKDDGVGLPENMLEDNGVSLGTRLIRAFAEKLDAEVEVKGVGGTEISLKIRDYQETRSSMTGTDG